CLHSDLQYFPTRRSSDLNGSIPPPSKKRIALFWIPDDRASSRIGTVIPWRLSMSNTLFAGVVRRVINPVTGHDKVGLRLFGDPRSEEHTSELQSPDHLVC